MHERGSESWARFLCTWKIKLTGGGLGGNRFFAALDKRANRVNTVEKLAIKNNWILLESLMWISWRIIFWSVIWLCDT